MSKPAVFWGLMLLLLAAPAGFAQSTIVWDLHDGIWTDLPSTRRSGPIADATLDHAQQLLSRGEHEKARLLLLAWEKLHKKAPDRDRCILLLADCFFQSDNRIKSFYYCDELMDEYPSSQYFQAALQKQFDIASAYLSGYDRMFLFFRILDTSDEGIEMMYRIQQRAPGSPLAEKALLKTADFYFEDKQFDLAADVYNTYVHNYPHSPQVPHAKLRAAFASLEQFRNVKYDATAIMDARAQLLDIEKQYPDLAAEENIPAFIEQIDSAFARKLWETAKYYERVHQPRGAIFEYRCLAERYPHSPEGVAARQRLRQFPVALLNEPPPPLESANFAPAATRPIAGIQY